jgi:ZIP family zinc transporter
MPRDTVVAVLLLAVLSGATTLVGVAMALWLGRSVRAIALGIGFSAGIMVAISMVELVPESVRLGGLGVGLGAATLGAGMVGLLHVLLPHVHLVEEEGKLELGALRSTYLVALGLILHDFPEGFAMANAYVASPSLGVLVALGIALHNVPEEFAMALPAVTSKRKRFLFGAALVSGLAEPAGAALGLLVVRIEAGWNAFLMAFAAGAMIFVSVHELLPMARRYGRLDLFAGGVALGGLVFTALSLALPR